MKKLSMMLMAFILFTTGAWAQARFYTKTATIEFFSSAPLEDIEAKNNTASAVLDTRSGAVQFSVLMKGFTFRKALMQEHFNDNYVESHKYPEAVFRGTVVNNKSVNYAKDGSYPAKVSGKMTIHGVTKNFTTDGVIKVDDGKLKLETDFVVLLSDYNIKIPALVKDKLSNSIRVTVDAKLQPLK